MEHNINRRPAYLSKLNQEKLSSFCCLALLMFVITVPNVSHSIDLDGYKYIGKAYVEFAYRPAKDGKFGKGIQEQDLDKYFDIKADEPISSDMFGSELNYAEIDLDDSTYSRVLVTQLGEGNYADIYVNGDGNFAWVAQHGDDNVALLAQDGGGNIATILQYGTDNTALVIQKNGDGNYATVIQINPSKVRLKNKVSVSQQGDNNVAFVKAWFGADVGISQTGTGSEILVNAARSMSVNIEYSN